MISNCSNCSLGVMNVTNACPSVIGSLSVPTYDVVIRRDTFVSLFFNVADFFPMLSFTLDSVSVPRIPQFK